MSFNVPILLLMFNRPHLVKLQIENLRKIRPSKLYVSSDGPRTNRKNDFFLVEECRRLVDEINWPCEVHKRYEERNLGCGRGVSSAIDWFFDNVEEGIIMEDDCQLSESFFPYCEELLNRYRNDQSIAGISADFRLLTCARPSDEYGFTRFAPIWGWATWRRVWKEYDYTVSQWSGDVKQISSLDGVGHRGLRYWQKNFDGVHSGQVDTWDFQLSFLVLSKNWKFIHPMRNLVTNIGYSSEATHTRSKNDDMANLPAFSISFPLRANSDFVEYDQYLAEKVCIERSFPEKVIKRIWSNIKGWF